MMLRKITQLAFFRGLEAEEIALLEPYFRSQTFLSGTTVFEQGAQTEFLYLVVRGEVVIQFKPEDGPQMIVTRVQPGGVFGWSAAVGNGTYTSGAVCVRDSVVLQVRGSDLRLICDLHPEVGKIILDRLAEVIAERKHSQQQLTEFLAQSIRHGSGCTES